ncbi:hypothetical protein B5X24_HaOG200692 [Helicoverpa armigera]|uniref:Gustatory receptor n=1 Tax=Helicoverpa armigera TaxID=29058 RepID=A0A2W1BZ29_HELAM|nr:hypothetical protein B5X24_HaOG200692 [Helicoverpa armigera]
MRSFKNIVNIYPKIINNKVDNDVQEMLYPLDFMQCLIFISKYHIRNNLIAPIGVITTFISMIATMAFVVVHIYQTLFATSETNSIASITTENITRYFSCVFYCSVFTINFIMCVIQTNKSIKFVLTYQKVHRFLKNSGSYSYNNNYIIWNWVFVITAVIWHTSTIVYCVVSIGYNFFVATCYMYPIMLFDINMVYAMRIIKLLENEINIWNDVIKSRLHTQDENYCRDLLNIYVEILECYEIFKDCFQQSVSISTNRLD